MLVGERVVVTGGSGKVGRWVVEGLLESGYTVTNVDRRHPEVELHCSTELADLRDPDQVRTALRDTGAVVHLAAHPTSGERLEGVIFRENTQIIYNVLEAASQLALRRVVCLSTMTVIYYPKPEWYAFEPRYLPVDESHPSTIRNAYSLSKQTGELAAAMFSRLGRLTAVSLRPAWIVMPGKIEAAGFLEPENLDDGLSGLWSYIDVRDVTRACAAALEAEVDQHEVFNLSAPDTFAPLPTRNLVTRLWPELSDFRDALDGFQALIDCRKARRQLGFEAIYSARD